MLHSLMFMQKSKMLMVILQVHILITHLYNKKRSKFKKKNKNVSLKI